MKDYLTSKEAYLNYKCYDEHHITKDDWWYHIQISPQCKNIKECTRCKQDLHAFRKAMRENESVNVILKCCRWCLWFEYFDFQRQSLAKGYNKKIVYYPKVIKNKDESNRNNVRWYMKLE